MRFLFQIGLCLIVSMAAVAQAEDGDDEKKDTPKQEYKQTPFGKVAKKKAPPPTPVRKQKSNIAVSVDGEAITFSRPTPFGTQRWTRKRSELNAVEKSWLAEYESASTKAARAAPTKARP